MLLIFCNLADCLSGDGCRASDEIAWRDKNNPNGRFIPQEKPNNRLRSWKASSTLQTLLLYAADYPEPLVLDAGLPIRAAHSRAHGDTTYGRDSGGLLREPGPDLRFRRLVPVRMRTRIA